MTEPNPLPQGSTSERDLADWQHLHPLSPILRGGVVGVAIIGYAATQFIDDIFRSLTGGSKDPGDEAADQSLREGLGFLFDHSLATAAVIVTGLTIVGLFGWLAWRFAKFRVADGQIEFRKGWLFREHRQVPLERVQAIEISRPLLAQITGLSQVIVQSAGGGDSQLKLAFLSSGRADEVRRELLALAGRRDEAGPRTAAGAPAGADGIPTEGSSPHPLSLDEGHEVFRVPNGRLFVATILHGGTIFLGLVMLLAAAVALAAYGSRFEALTGVALALPALGPIALGIAVNRVGELLKHGNFRLAETGTSVRIQHGLTDKRTNTVPLHRIQAVGMVQPLWWRPLGWWRVKVNVAGVAHDPTGTNDTETTVLPVGNLQQALDVLTLLDPVLSAEDLRRAALGEGTEGGWTLVSPRARRFDPLSWRRAGFAATPHSVMVRTGRLSRKVSVMPHARVQSLTMAQGPLERRLDLAGVTLVSTPGPVSVSIAHLDLETATTLLREESARAGAARKFARSGCTSADVPSQLVTPDPHDER
ncbi:PH domain-containing protein [Knoellia subterranea]|uniref:Membrane protein n=1 Tax=Knoellia subterranea KCTC 19937 TaxID=1385521 RepID=A0A0A0JNP8_9MICO|nr:PH domain-containing protein [Knoellia subterranea]KGN39000.1 membrane protein [Knoellia subterranea KCTC 19937]